MAIQSNLEAEMEEKEKRLMLKFLPLTILFSRVPLAFNSHPENDADDDDVPTDMYSHYASKCGNKEEEGH